MANSLVKDAAGNVIAISVPPSGSDDTSNLQAAITLATNTYGDNVEIWLNAGGSYSTTGLTFNNYTKLIGWGCSLALPSGHNGPAITIPSTAIIKTIQRSYVEKLVIVGNNVNGGSGGPTGSEVGIQISDHATFSMRDVTVENCWTGFNFYGTQFCNFHGLRALGCGVSYFLSPQVTDEGGNSNSFYDCGSVDAYVHLIVAGSSTAAPGCNMFFNPSWEGSYCAGLACFKNGAPAGCQLNLYGGSIENTGRDATALSSYTYVAPNSMGTFVVPESGLYASGFTIIWEDLFNEDAYLGNAIWGNLTSGSHLVLVRPQGFGISYGLFVECDDTSDVELNSLGGSLNGTIEGITALTGCVAQPNVSLQCMLVVSPQVTIDTTLPNGFQQPSTAQADGINAPFGGAVTFPTDAVFGPCVEIAMSPTQSGSPIDIPVMFPASGTNRVVIAYNIMCTEDVDMGSTISSNQNVNQTHLVANVWRRVVQIWDTALNGSQTLELKLEATVGSGFACYLQKFQLLSGPVNSAQTNSQINRIAQGAYNSKKTTVAALQSYITANIVDNTSNAITPAMVRTTFNDIVAILDDSGA